MEVRVDRNQPPQQPKIQIYSTPNDEISGFWKGSAITFHFNFKEVSYVL